MRCVLCHTEKSEELIDLNLKSQVQSTEYRVTGYILYTVYSAVYKYIVAVAV